MRSPRGTATATSLDLRAGAGVIVAVRLASVAFLAIFLAVLDQIPHRRWLAVLLVAVALGHVSWWQRYVRGSRPMTKSAAMTSLLADVIATGIAVIMTGGPSSPVVFIWASSCAATAIWVGLRDGLPVIVTVIGFLLASAFVDVGRPLELTDLQLAIFASFWLVLVTVHGDVVAAFKRSFQREIDVAHARAATDPLTQLANRARCEERIQAALAANEHFTVALLDIDDFKAINDTHGHAVGDRVLTTLADHMRAHIRPSDLAARLGGEEFALVLPSTGPHSAREIVERIRGRFRSGGPLDGLSFSAGIAPYPASGTTMEELYLSADIAMYAAKRAGKARTVVAAAPPRAADGEEARMTIAVDP